MELSERLGLCPGRERIVSIVGAGGKTTLMYALAGEYARRGLRVGAGTTTHILRPAGRRRVAVVCDGDPGALERALAGGRIAVAGTPARGAPGKLAAPRARDGSRGSRRTPTRSSSRRTAPGGCR